MNTQTQSTLFDVLSKFPKGRGTSNKWPGLRLALDCFSAYRVVLAYADGYAEVKGVRGAEARRTFATINLATGDVELSTEKYMRYLNERKQARLIEHLSALWRSPEEFCAKHGRDMNFCCFCGANLSTLESRERGYGPECAKKWRLPWG